MEVEIILHTFRASWQNVAMASWLKYPAPSRPDYLGLDLIDKHFDPDTGVLRTYRLSEVEGVMPAWVCSLAGGQCSCLFLEKSYIDPENQFMQLVTENVTCDGIISVQEICTYTPDPDNPGYTLFRQDAKIKGHVWGVSNQLAKLGIFSFKRNAQKGRDIMREAIDYIPLAIQNKVWDPKLRKRSDIKN